MYVSNILYKLTTCVIQMLILCIQLFRPFFGAEGVCPFTIGCTEYAIMQLEQNHFLTAMYNIIKRILICNPLYNLYIKNS